jgi:thioester reductase-like protein
MVMLTGATGFLGSFLLSRLLRDSHLTVACLVRASDKTAGFSRVKATLEKYHLWQDNFAARITVYIGDLALPRLGVSDSDWTVLCEQVDEIYHNGAQVNFLYNYQALKKANVGSTLEIIDLATSKKLKRIHYVSTLSVFSPLDHSAGRCAETTMPGGKTLQGGYAQSKWVAEQLLLQANSHGLPLSVYRPGRITGDSVRGIANTDDFFYQVLKGCYELMMDYYPEDVYMDMTPVDYVSNAIVKLARTAGPEVEIYHLCNPQCSDSALFDTIGQRGHPMQACDYGRWQSELKLRLADLPQDRMGAFNVILKTNPDDLNKGNNRMMPFSCDLTVAALTRTESQVEGKVVDEVVVSCPPVDEKLCGLYLDYLVDSGFIPPLDITSQRSEIVLEEA